MTLLAGFKVIQIGDGAAAAVCGRLLADVGAEVTCIDPGAGTPLLAHLNHGKAVAAAPAERRAALAAAHLIVREGANPWELAGLRRINASAAVVTISPYGETGPQADDPATDLTLFFASGIARQLTGQVDDLRKRRSVRWASSRRSSAGWRRPVPACTPRWATSPARRSTCRSRKRWRRSR